MTAVVDSYPRLGPSEAPSIPEYFPEDPDEVVKAKPKGYVRHVSYDSEPSDSAPSSPVSTQPNTPLVEKPAPQKQVSITSEIQVIPSTFEDSTTAILRHYTDNGRPASFHLSASGRPREEPAMSEIFRVGGKEYLVTLEEDLIKWTRRLAPGRQSAQVNKLYLSDLFAVVHGAPVTTPTSSSHSRQPSVSSITTTSTLPRPTRSATPNQGLDFTLHALKSEPGSVGKLVKVTFRGRDANTCQMWAEQVMHKMYNFGNRPRRLYVIVNPTSGGGRGSTEKTWAKVQQMFTLGQIVTEVMFTTQRFQAREQLQSLDLSQYDGVVAVGGDGLFNEIMNGLLIKTQHQGGVNMRNPNFFPLTPNIRLGVIPTGFNNSISRSAFGCRNPFVAAAQIMLGCSSPMDVCSVSQNNQLLLFSAGAMAYGFWSDMALFSEEFSWLGSRRFDFATLRTLISRREFEAEIQFVPAEDPEELVVQGEKCVNRCPKCSNFESSGDGPSSAANEKGACLMAVNSGASSVDNRQWKTLKGHFTSVMACPHICRGLQAPHGISPFGHLGNGCTDLILLSRCSKFEHAKFLLKQRRGNSQFNHPYVHIRRVKEFYFREILKPARGSRAVSEHSQEPEDNADVHSMDNLMDQDDDDVTNRRAQTAAGPGPGLPTSRWNIDGDEMPRADIEVRVHRQLVSVFARGPEPLVPDSSSSSEVSVDQNERSDDDELIHTPK